MTRFDVVAFGNALVDILAYEDDATVIRAGLERGAMTLVDGARADEIYAAMSPTTEVSGGSAANTMAGIASFGGRAAFIGRIADDTFGRVFAHDLRSAGVHFDPPIARGAEPTGRCLVMVTPDAQRTLCTHLGTGVDLDPTYVDEALIADAAVTYLEGYLWDQPPAKEAMRSACRTARANGRHIAFTLSDPFCVERNRDEFLHLVEHEVDVLFANEHEITSLYSVERFDDALQHVRGHCEIAVLTRGPLGAVVVAGDEVHVIDPVATTVVDTTGAGDLFAAGFLYGLTAGHPLSACGRLGAAAAAEVISHLGARPAVSLAELAAPILD
ncbi:MAG: adenosine kinase [Actinomycetota bacterium]